jgi:transcriptional regulator with XRE-family HTH domain
MKLCAINDRPSRWVLLNQSGKLSSKGGQLLGGRGKTRGAIDLHVASRVRERRIGLGISQRQLASALGLTFQQLHKYEQGKSRISAGRLYELGKVLGVPITFFVEDIADTLTPVTLLETGDHTDELGRREAGELFAAYRAISDPLLRLSVRRLARAFAPEPNGSTAKASASQRRRPSRRVHT